MRRRVILTICMVLLFFSVPLSVEGTENIQNVYVVPITGEIGPAVYQFVKSSVREIEKDNNAVAIIFEIDTYGGSVASAVDISEFITKAKLPTISFVNAKAISAGVLLTISADTIVMAPRSTIGAAETIPNTEKTLSAWTGILRTVAQEKGRDPELVASMADKSIHIPGVVEEGRLLSLTTKEAEELGFTDLVASSYEEVLEALEISYTNIIVEEIPTRVKWAQFLTSSYVIPVLLTIGFVGMVVEILTAGFGIGGTVSIIAFALYFGGSLLAGYAGIAVIILFLTGILLLTIEAFVPGFGVPGIGGIICIIVSIILAANNIITAVVSLLIAFILAVAAVIVVLKYAPRNKIFDRIILRSTVILDDSENNEGKGLNQYVGKTGTVLTFLRPAGTVDIDGEILHVISEGSFIEAGSTVKVVRVEGKKIIVRKMD